MSHGANMRTRWMIFAVLGALTLGAASRACTVDMSVPTLADHAAQVVIADIRAVRSYWAADPRRIETELTLENIEYLKGAYDGAPTRRTLIVPGGRVGEWGMRLCCAPEYQAGERWMLFILPTCKVHPVVGMERGSLRIVRDEQGAERVLAADGRAIIGIGADGALERAGRAGTHADHAHADATTLNAQSGVRLVHADAPEPAPDPQAMTLAAFRERVAPTLAASRDHAMEAPAGARVPADHRAVPVRQATPPRASEHDGEVSL